MRSPTDPRFRWPEGAVVYQIYPRSFKDGNGDGVGDIPGIISELDYLAELGVTAIWLSPFYPSPMADFGYDIADYCNVDPLFGTLADFKNLLAGCAERDIKVIIDLVPNHTSDEHAWFAQSRTSRDNPYHDWYIWRDPNGQTDDGTPLPPNNWRDALTGGSAWQWVEERRQFYLHSFDVKQPDLNWSNQAVHEAIKSVMRFWLDMGVDGFRVDAVYWMAKEPLFKNDSVNPSYIEGKDLLYEALLHDNSRGWPMVYAYLADMVQVLKEAAYQHKQHFMVTEAYPERHNPLASYMSFYVAMDPEVAAPFNFEGLSLPWKAPAWRNFLRGFNKALTDFNPLCLPSYAFGNHDQPRLVSRLGEAAARSVAVMQLTLPGMAFIYYGEEIGMHDVVIPEQFVHDPAAKGNPQHGIGRDPERTPLQWSAEPNAGFSAHNTTWLPVAHDYPIYNIAAERTQTHSFLNLYKRLIELRRTNESLTRGHFHIIDSGQPDILAYSREVPNEPAMVVVINFSDKQRQCVFPHLALQLIISSEPGTTLSADRKVEEFELKGYEAALFEAHRLTAK